MPKYSSYKIPGAYTRIEGSVEMTADEAKSLVRTLRKEFGGKVKAELVDQKKGRYRFSIVSENFNDTNHLDRQDAVWEVVDKYMPRKKTLDISLILAFAPDDLVPT